MCHRPQKSPKKPLWGRIVAFGPILLTFRTEISFFSTAKDIGIKCMLVWSIYIVIILSAFTRQCFIWQKFVLPYIRPTQKIRGTVAAKLVFQKQNKKKPPISTKVKLKAHKLSVHFREIHLSICFVSIMLEQCVCMWICVSTLATK